MAGPAVGSALRIGLELFGAQAFQSAMSQGAKQAEEIQHSISRATESIGSIVNTIRIGGGTGGQGGMLGGLARLSGDDPNNTADAARSFRERLSGSPMAQATLGRGALSAETGQLVNESELYLQAQRQILEARSDEEARVKAQIYGLERLLPLRDADARLIQEQMRVSEENGRLVDDDLRRQRANLQAQRAIREEMWERVAIGVEKLLLPIEQWWERLSTGVAGWIANLLPGAHASGQASPMDRNTQAMNSLTEELLALRKDWLNGRERTNSAFPRNLRGDALNHALERGAFDLGAVTF